MEMQSVDEAQTARDMAEIGDGEMRETLDRDPTAESGHPYTLIAQAIRYLEERVQEQPGLDEMARALAVSPGHLQRTFQRWAGISPKRFLQYLTVSYAKQRLDASRSVLEAAYAAGLSGPGRLHDHFVRVEALSPGEYKAQAAGLTIRYGLHPTPFGPALLAVTPRGINAIAFVEAEEYPGEVAQLARRWPRAYLDEDTAHTRAWAARLFARREPGTEIPVLLKGTPFQIKVWEALLRVPEGALCTYGDLARRVCGPKAARAVGAAVAANPIAYLIPCHRVIRQSGVIYDYRWGSTRKKALVGWEAARLEGG